MFKVSLVHLGPGPSEKVVPADEYEVEGDVTHFYEDGGYIVSTIFNRYILSIDAEEG